MKQFFIFIIICLFPTTTLHSQDYGEFRSPLGIPLFLSGTFAELRTNHFHGGLDIKTNGQEGYRIYAAKEGFVSRIGVSSRGYGNALYLEHPNGYTTVYGHLSEFNEVITNFVKNRQYNSQSFDQDIYLQPYELPVQKGEVIALSGNSGSSGGPHLHFEIRQTNGQVAINPMEFIPILDDINPSISKLKVYELNGSVYNSKNKTYDVKYISSGTYRLIEPVIVSKPVVGFSIKAIDKLNGSNNSNGFASLQMKVDGVVTFAYNKKAIPFEKTRYLNAHIDYPTKSLGGGTYSNCFKLPGNTLDIYDPIANDGRIWLSQFPEREVEINVRDFAGNTSTLMFKVIFQENSQISSPSQAGQYFAYNTANYFNQNGININIPNGALYDDILFEYQFNPAITTKWPVYSSFHKVHDEKIPLQKFITVSVEAQNFPDELRSKALMANLNSGGKIDVNTGEWVGNQFQTETRKFGTYFITTDTQAPAVRLSRARSGNDYSGAKSIDFIISDDLSGIDTFRGEVDGQWVLFTYDAKRSFLTHVFDQHISKGEHNLKLVVLDQVGNQKEFTLTFKR